MKGNPLKDQNPQEWKSQTLGPMKTIQMPFFSSKKVGFWQMYLLLTLISLINVEVGINVEGVQKLPNH